MSSDGIRKQTKGWEISPTGQMINIVDSDDVAVVDEGSSSHSAPTVVSQSSARLAQQEPRGKKSTLETFNAEMAVLERPLEGEVEYFDEVPPPSRWRRVGLFAGIVVVMGLGGGLVLSRQQAPVDAQAQAPQPAAPVAAPAPAAAVAPAVLAATAPAAAAEAPAAAPAPAGDEGADADEAAADPEPAPAKRSAWSNVRSTKAGNVKVARASSGKTTVRRTTTTTTRRTVVKRSARHK